MTLDTPDVYSLTATAAVECLHRVLEGAVEPGFQTPAQALAPISWMSYPALRLPMSSLDLRIPALQLRLDEAGDVDNGIEVVGVDLVCLERNPEAVFQQAHQIQRCD